jgi:uncharacterized protein YmfQ (DUF2313 family)
VEWERALGLPEKCGAIETRGDAARRTAVVRKLTELADTSQAGIAPAAAQAGFTIELEELFPKRVGQIRAGDRLEGPEANFVLGIHAPETTVFYARAGSARAGDPVARWGNEPLECFIRRITPAHVELIFAYDLVL